MLIIESPGIGTGDSELATGFWTHGCLRNRTKPQYISFAHGSQCRSLVPHQANSTHSEAEFGSEWKGLHQHLQPLGRLRAGAVRGAKVSRYRTLLRTVSSTTGAYER